jgi:hypothetical protein
MVLVGTALLVRSLPEAAFPIEKVNSLGDGNGLPGAKL